jgi:hypothetical protein
LKRSGRLALASNKLDSRSRCYQKADDANVGGEPGRARGLGSGRARCNVRSGQTKRTLHLAKLNVALGSTTDGSIALESRRSVHQRNVRTLPRCLLPLWRDLAGTVRPKHPEEQTFRPSLRGGELPKLHAEMNVRFVCAYVPWGFPQALPRNLKRRSVVRR